MKTRGFTLIELMVCVAVLGILAVIAVPKFAELTSKAKEAETKGHLGAIRSALTMYYTDCDFYPFLNDASVYPPYTDGSARPKIIRVLNTYKEYLSKEKIIAFRSGHHPEADGVDGPLANVEGTGASSNGWIYGSEDGPSGERGRIYVNCTHRDYRGVIWSSY